MPDKTHQVYARLGTCRRFAGVTRRVLAFLGARPLAGRTEAQPVDFGAGPGCWPHFADRMTR